MTAPPLAVTMGDPSGIGPEIVVAALARTSPVERRGMLVVGDVARLRVAAQIQGIDISISEKEGADVQVLQVGAVAEDLAFGQISAEAGALSYAYVQTAIQHALAGEVSAVVTAPINKEAWSLAGIGFADHTSALVELTGAEHHAMMLATDELRSVLVTTHLSLRDAIDSLTPESILETITVAHVDLVSQGIQRPKIAVAALNPHAGESGLFGREELDVIAPAIATAREAGIDASGPFPADTIFMRARRGEFDAVIAMYHDQGLIPIKLLGIDDGVNVTLGLPIIRTSVDHGTAMEIAGTGRASGESLLYAIKSARRLVDAKNKHLNVGAQP